MAEPVIKSPSVQTGEIFNLSGETARVQAPSGLDDIRYELSFQNDRFPDALKLDPHSPMHEQEAAYLAREADFSGIMSVANSFGEIRLHDDRLSARLNFEPVFLNYDDKSRVLGLAMRDKGALFGLPHSPDRFETELEYDLGSERFKSGKLLVEDGGFEAGLMASEDQKSWKLGFKDPDTGFRCNVRYDYSPDASDWVTLQLQDPDKSLAFRMSPDGNLYGLKGSFKVREDLTFASDTFFSQSELKQRCSILFSRPGATASFDLECRAREGREPDFSGMLKLEIYNLNFKRR